MIDAWTIERWFRKRNHQLKEWAPLWSFILGVAAIAILVV